MSREATSEISQTQRVWFGGETESVLKGRWNWYVANWVKDSAALSGRMILLPRIQPRCGWLISGCPVGTKSQCLRRDILLKNADQPETKLREERHIPPRLPRRSAAKTGMKVGRGWGICCGWGYKDFARDKTIDAARPYAAVTKFTVSLRDIAGANRE